MRRPRGQIESEIEGIVAGVHPALPRGQLLKGDVPTSAVGKLAEVNDAAFFPGLAGSVHQEEGIGVVAGLHAAAFQRKRARH